MSGIEEQLPGLSLQEWLDASEVSYSAFSRMIACSVGYPRMIAQGLARPSYDMATVIEAVTDGAVPRTRWYPPGPAQEPSKDDSTIEDLI